MYVSVVITHGLCMAHSVKPSRIYDKNSVRCYVVHSTPYHTVEKLMKIDEIECRDLQLSMDYIKQDMKRKFLSDIPDDLIMFSELPSPDMGRTRIFKVSMKIYRPMEHEYSLNHTTRSQASI
jgi:hypothetical protein